MILKLNLPKLENINSCTDIACKFHTKSSSFSGLVGGDQKFLEYEVLGRQSLSSIGTQNLTAAVLNGEKRYKYLVNLHNKKCLPANH